VSLLALASCAFIDVRLLRWLYVPSINVDGNFELEHLAMKDPLSDVSLSNGEGFMVEQSQFLYHLGFSVDSKEVRYKKVLYISKLTFMA
jgi:hypothetical protein